MHRIRSEDEIREMESQRALIAIYVDRAYNPEKLDWLFELRMGFDAHARDSWHLLIPVKEGYSVDSWVAKEDYNVELAGYIIDRLEIDFDALPCIVFRAEKDDYFYLKLGGKSRHEFDTEIGLIADLARRCQVEGSQDGETYREHVNRSVAVHLRRRKLLSAAKSALPAISSLIGAAAGIGELV